jgi:hypothetical protein
MTKRPIRLVVCSVAACLSIVVLSACGKKKAGSACTGDEALCSDKQTILECHDGKLVEMACKGPKGCAEAATGAKRAGRNVTVNYAVSCDFSGNAVGETCTTNDSFLCSPDKSAMLRCKDKKIVSTACRGPKKCSESATQVDCDSSIAQVGESCDDGYACSTDAKATLKCAAGKWAVDEPCKKSCKASGNSVGCDG